MSEEDKPTLMEQAVALFGLQFKRPDEDKPLPSFAPKIEDDGAVMVAAGGQYGTYVDLDGTVRTEAELVNKYRDMSLHPEIDLAIENIVNEAIVIEEGSKTVEVILDDLDEELPDNVKKIIEQEFEEVLRLLEFNSKQYDIFRRWYVDGRLYYHVMVDNDKLNEGIKELRFLDPRKVRKIREVVKQRDPRIPQMSIPKTVTEYYLYTEKGMAGGNRSLVPQTSSAGIKIAKDSVVHTTSGLTDTNGTMILGYLHKAIKGLNQLRALEDASLIYCISRAPERRIFYVDVGNLPRIKAEQYVRDLMTKYKNKLVYDQNTGEIRDDRKFMTMNEDYWLPRREGGKGTEIDTLPAGTLTGELGSVEYFLHKVYRSLNVPIGRLNPDAVFDPGRSSVVSRDEILFAKFIDRLRMKFTKLFLGLLEKQLVLKQVMSPEDWDTIKDQIGFRFLRDNRYAELAESEILAERLARCEQLAPGMPIVGRYVSNEWLRKKVLRMTDEEIEEEDKKIEEEATNPQFMAPLSPEMDNGVPGGNGFDQMPSDTGEDVPGPPFAGMSPEDAKASGKPKSKEPNPKAKNEKK